MSKSAARTSMDGTATPYDTQVPPSTTTGASTASPDTRAGCTCPDSLTSHRYSGRYELFNRFDGAVDIRTQPTFNVCKDANGTGSSIPLRYGWAEEIIQTQQTDLDKYIENNPVFFARLTGAAAHSEDEHEEMLRNLSEVLDAAANNHRKVRNLSCNEVSGIEAVEQAYSIGYLDSQHLKASSELVSYDDFGEKALEEFSRLHPDLQINAGLKAQVAQLSRGLLYTFRRGRPSTSSIAQWDERAHRVSTEVISHLPSFFGDEDPEQWEF